MAYDLTLLSDNLGSSKKTKHFLNKSGKIIGLILSHFDLIWKVIVLRIKSQYFSEMRGRVNSGPEKIDK